MTDQLEAQISQWRDFARGRRAVQDVDVEELEDHLRAQIDELTAVGLSPDESFLIAVKRMGGLDAVSHEFAQEHSDRLWRQLVLPGGPAGDAGSGPDIGEFTIVLLLALGAATAAISLLALVDDDSFVRHLPLTVLPFVFAYLALKRDLDRRPIVAAAAAFVVGVAAMVFYPFDQSGDLHTLNLAAIHLPIALWFAVGLAYVGGRWRNHDRRMDFVRFTGETFIYFALIGFGGGVLIALTYAIFDGVGVDADPVLTNVVLPGGMAGAVLVAAWLVEARQGVIEAMAPVLTRVFSPLFTILFVVFLVTVAATGQGFDVDRDILILIDLLLVVVLGLVLYSVSSRDPRAEANWFDWLQLAMIASALAIDIVGLAAILGRISEFGFSANKTAALGENLVLLVNLGVTAWLYVRFLQRQVRFDAVSRWQTSYLVVYPIWAALVVLAFPPLFSFQ
ncbi:MAG: permease prefix domain 1-containing protein [Acidimicrobiia bacterium]|nr:permease prefix domain 1-containing protein [Acidimicrobiia bacterium]MDH5521189.1 permease prefix domain 1-containing protein [Acidimicrobiia bacterium]